MAAYTIENEKLSVTIDAHGAELSSIYDKENDRELSGRLTPLFGIAMHRCFFPM